MRHQNSCSSGDYFKNNKKFVDSISCVQCSGKIHTSLVKARLKNKAI